MSTTRWRASLAALSIAGLSAAAVATAPPALATEQTRTFECTGADQTWTVPGDVTVAHFAIYGAAGGDVGNVGGNGALLEVHFPVTPNEVLTIRVGCQGENGAALAAGGGGAGGYGGGANGGDPSPLGGVGGAGGGGASDIRRGGSDLANRVLVAGGGGGAAYDAYGGGGGNNGLDGGDAPGEANAQGGGGAIGNTGGALGTPGGNAGALGVGGAGGTNPGASGGVAGGGGGGGWAGGGGGGFDGTGWGGGGGGGGSSLGVAGTSVTQEVREGDGQVVITFDSITFTDVPIGPPPHPFYDEIMWMATNGIAGGFPDGTYRPTVSVTRQAMAAFLYRLEDSPNGDDPVCPDAPFPDVPASHPFCGEIDWMVGEGITTGFPDGNFRPGVSISRQSMAAFLYRLAGEAPDPTCNEDPFPDVATTHPFCGEIDWMANNNITGGFDDGTFRPSSPVTRQAMAAFIQRYANLPPG